MIAGGDDVARSAFWVSLREQPSSPSLVTQELDPADILEVRDVAEAIARAEAIVRTPIPFPKPSSSRDLFDELATRSPRHRPTDDAVGPATPAAPRVSTVPPPPAPAEAVELEAAEVEELEAEPAPHAARVPAVVAMAAEPVRIPAPSAPVLLVPAVPAGPDEDAYFHPGGRIRGFGEVTLDGYRPDSTLLVRLRQRRSRLGWVVTGALVLLTTFSAAALLTPGPVVEVARTAPLGSPARETPTRITFASSRAKLARLDASAPAPLPAKAAGMPVFDVKSLPRAR